MKPLKSFRAAVRKADKAYLVALRSKNGAKIDAARLAYESALKAEAEALCAAFYPQVANG